MGDDEETPVGSRQFVDTFRHDLLAVVKPSEHHERLLGHKKPGFFKWLLFNYLYIRIPLVNPDGFLSRTIKYFRFLGSKVALAISFVIEGFLYLGSTFF